MRDCQRGAWLRNNLSAASGIFSFKSCVDFVKIQTRFWTKIANVGVYFFFASIDQGTMKCFVKNWLAILPLEFQINKNLNDFKRKNHGNFCTWYPVWDDIATSMDMIWIPFGGWIDLSTMCPSCEMEHCNTTLTKSPIAWKHAILATFSTNQHLTE